MTDKANRRKTGHFGFPAVVAACFLLSMAVVFLCACKPTDLFTDIVINPWAEDLYEEADPITVNSPDAEQESSFLTSFDWTEKSKTSESVENLVVYSSDPNYDLTTHHTHFDSFPMFHGIESSDGVHFIYNASGTFEHTADANSQDTPPEEESEVTSQGSITQTGEVQADNQSEEQGAEFQNGVTSDDPDAPSPDEDEAASEGDAPSDEGSDDTSTGDESEGNGPGDEGSGEGEVGDNGDEDDPYGGYGDPTKVKHYDPGSAFSKPQEADHVAVLGTDAAVMVQALGGKGAICAMSEYAYKGKEENGEMSSCRPASSFKEIFADQLEDGFADDALLWKQDGSQPSYLTDTRALLEACGEDGVIVYDQRLGDYPDLFNDDQLARFEATGIQLVPVDMRTVDGMLDAANVIGKILKNSKDCTKDAAVMAETYRQCVKDIVNACGDTHGGTFATTPHGGSGTSHPELTTYNSCSLVATPASVTCCTAIDYETGVKVSYASVNSSDILLFTKSDKESSPFHFWQQVAGVWSDAFNWSPSSSYGLEPLWPMYRASYTLKDILADYPQKGTTATWLAQKNSIASLMHHPQSDATGNSVARDGLGTKNCPYLIICSTDDTDASQIKKLTTQSIMSYIKDGEITTYSALPQNGGLIGFDGNNISGLTTVACNDETISSYTQGDGLGGNVFAEGLDADDAVRENPNGLLSSWTEGNMESVLEAVWLTGLYSVSPDGCPYKPEVDMSEFSLTIEAGDYSTKIDGKGKSQAAVVKSVVKAFYKAFYDYDINDSLYSEVIPDVGL